MLQSKRITLRKMESEDIPTYHEWRNDIEVMQTTNLDLDRYSVEETKQFVETVILGSQQSKTYILEERDEKQRIGITSLIHVDYKNRNAECIIDIGHKEYWGKGYATEALQLLLDYAFLELNMHRIALRVFSFNEKAIHVYKKIGFIEEGRSRESIYRNGDWHDIIHMGILKEEYRSVK
ncbi:LOW QUALITY PROTEIN: acetyltransferase [Bacillus sp. JCM 19046]|nr:LOW QUALITY PROTEIN: acetyltransferase [Bacillus sp. JCM 19046]